ncbi:alpha/beta-hydrolase, partial [Rhizopus microsporus var. microsporus]
IKILDCLFNVKVKKPYIVLTLGDQCYQSNLEECKNKTTFDFQVTFHTQLFGTMQLDLFDTGTFYSTDKHLGRTEIRLGLLKHMPLSFTNYYEIWDRTLSSGASSSIGRERTRINYQFVSLENSKDDMVQLPAAESVVATNLVMQEQIVAEAKRHMQFNRERQKKRKEAIQIKERIVNLHSESGEEDLIQPLATDDDYKASDNEEEEEDDEFGEMVSAPSDNVNGDFDSTSEESMEVKGKDTGQGFELTHMQVVTGLSLLEKFFTDLPRQRSWDIVRDLSEIETAARFWKFSIASYGWKGLNFMGKGNGILSDAIREHSDARSIVEYLIIPKEDLLAYEFRSSEAFRPSYFIARDRFTNSIVLSIRGTMSIMDTLTDLVCEYEPWKGGYVHSGMKQSAVWFYQYVLPLLRTFIHENNATGLVIVGHSLGAATAAILTDMLMECLDTFPDGKDFNIKCFGYAPACGLSLDLAEKHKDVVQSFVFAEDIVSKLSYGSMMDVKELVIASAEAAKNTVGISDIILGNNKLEGERWKCISDRVSEVRKRLMNQQDNPRLYVAGQIYQFWNDPTPSNQDRITIEKTTAMNVSEEVVIKKSILTDHLPTNFDLAFRKAREALMLEGTMKRSV